MDDLRRKPRKHWPPRSFLKTSLEINVTEVDDLYTESFNTLLKEMRGATSQRKDILPPGLEDNTVTVTPP